MLRQSLVRQPWWGVHVALGAGLLLLLPVLLVLGPILFFALRRSEKLSGRCAAVLLPFVMGRLDEAFFKVKRELVKDWKGGRLLDVGCGSGLWLKYFTNVDFVTELEPNVGLHPHIKRSVAEFSKENPKVQVEVVSKFVSELDPAQPYDYVVFGNVMCEVPDQVSFLHDVDRILKPGGQIAFVEHVRCDGDWRGRLQDAINWFWVVMSGGCNCNRRSVSVMKDVPGWSVQNWPLEAGTPLVVINRMEAGLVTKANTSG